MSSEQLPHGWRHPRPPHGRDHPVRHAIEPILDALDARRGALLASSYEYPGRYTRWDMGFVDPPLALTARGRRFRAEALNRARPGPAPRASAGRCRRLDQSCGFDADRRRRRR